MKCVPLVERLWPELIAKLAQASGIEWTMAS
jgi:hypothetical protein